MDRTILHCDMNSFFCSVELLSHPELKDKPVAVAGNAENRHGIILAKNEAAKKFNVQTAEPNWQAMEKCPGLILLEPHHDKYQRYCHILNQIYLRYTDLVEPFSVDESWLDVTGSLKLFGMTGKEMADSIRNTVYKETGLTQSVGVSFNKIFAKMGSDYKKPFATTEITRENYKELLWPLPVRDMFFVGRQSAAKLEALGIHTIGELAAADSKLIVSIFGKSGAQMINYANGLDTSPVEPYDKVREVKSVGHGMTFKRNLYGRADVLTGVTAISDRVAARLRKYGLKASGVKVDIKDPNFMVISRQMQMPLPSNLAVDIADCAMKIIDANWHYGSKIRLITITGINLIDETSPVNTQLTFFDSPDAAELEKRNSAVENTMDRIRQKFGNLSIMQGSAIGNDIGLPQKKDDNEN